MSAQRTVLVVDDSAVMRRLISEIVDADPDFHVVDVAENGRVALTKVREHKPDCVLLDIEMPELSGLDTLRRLGLRSSSKVIIVSHLGFEGSRERAEALRLGAADVIDKPSGSVSMDIASARGSLINRSLRRVLGLPPREVSTPPVAARAIAFDPNVLTAVVDAIDVGVLVFDRRGQLVYANTAADHAFEDRTEGLVGVDDLFRGENAEIATAVREVVATGRSKHPVLAARNAPRISVLPVPAQSGGGAFVLVDGTSRAPRKESR